MTGTSDDRARTVLEQLIRERRETYREFVAYAARFAREHNEPGTLSERHVKRLAAGSGTNGAPLGEPRRATARLLERIFGLSIRELLRPPGATPDEDSPEQLRARLHNAARVDPFLIAVLREQLTALRRLDRQLGAIVAHDEVTTKTGQVTRLLGHSLTPATRAQLAALVAELRTLAGWQALDMGHPHEAWQHYEHGKTAAREADDPAYLAHTTAEQAFVLLDLGDTRTALDILATTRAHAEPHAEPTLRGWLAAAHGEALAANGNTRGSLRAYDRARELLPDEPDSATGPYVALDPTHLARWHGHALARLGHREAVDTLTAALADLDPTFTRAAAAVHTDLAVAYSAHREQQPARHHLDQAAQTAAAIGSTRQQRRANLVSA